MVYDPATKLFLWVSEGPSTDFFSDKDRLPDDIATQFFKNSMFTITEDEIVAHPANWRSGRSIDGPFPCRCKLDASLGRYA
jgi:hypothetical protein